MEEIIHYLELKNHYYEKFLVMTQRFLEMTHEKRWGDIDLFVDNRDRILGIIRSYDFKIASIFEGLDTTKIDLKIYRERVRDSLQKRREWVDRIVATDLELIQKIEEMKTETIRDLKKTLETQQQMESYNPQAPTTRGRREA